MSNRPISKIVLEGRVVDGGETHEARATLSTNGCVLIVEYMESGSLTTMKVTRPTRKSKSWVGQGSGDSFDPDVKVKMSTCRFTAANSIVLDGTWTQSMYDTPSELDTSDEMRWELWPLGGLDPSLKPKPRRPRQVGGRSGQKTERKAGRKTDRKPVIKRTKN
jgi:hypothetical protein